MLRSQFLSWGTKKLLKSPSAKVAIKLFGSHVWKDISVRISVRNTDLDICY